MSGPSKKQENLTALSEFVDFVEAAPCQPTAQLEALVMGRVTADLQRRQWPIFGKVLGIEVAAGAATLFICPQFDIGFGSHNQFLHALHTTLPPLLFYLVCGALFVFFGALLSGVMLSRVELAAIRRSQYLYHPLFALGAFFLFIALGAEMALLSGLTWLAGAWAANVIGLGFTGRARLVMD